MNITRIKRSVSNSGNVLFLILIAVALFAALSYVVMQSNRNPSGNISEYTMQLAFDEILNHVSSLRTAVQRIVFHDGFKYISAKFPVDSSPPFSHSTYPFQNGTNCPSSGTKKSCLIYHPQGGGVAFYDFVRLHPDLATPPYDMFSTFLGQNGWGDATPSPGYPQTGTPDIDVIYNIRITRSFCDYINKRIGVNALDSYTGAGSATNPSGIEFRTQFDTFNVDNAGTAGVGITGQAHASHLLGRDMGCFHSNRSGGGFYFIALIYLR